MPDLIKSYQEVFNGYLKEKVRSSEPSGLYDPMCYILDLGGKRLRPVLTLISASAFGINKDEALDAALAIEVFHNFTLLHDDIMDEAPLRRGQPTVHHKWDINTGILSGDAMLIYAYQLFETYPEDIFKPLMQLFSQTAREVCEGQQYDMDFETREDVTIPEYMLMITYKTAVLVAAAMRMGAIIARTSEENQKLIYDFGKNLGIAFQLQDDYLDAFGDPETFGKQVGGDIIENKKTYLYLKARELASPEVANDLDHLFSIKPKNPVGKISTVLEIYRETGAAEATREAIAGYTRETFEVLENLELTGDYKTLLRSFAENLMDRKV
ncbi:polyprenyl synthetase family protein [Lentiprolixibacter aurantiacus]|uniref:Polyprenyl synthetase family protein n=1 Tax=Lentiprolixibacter aurantiacus TaxID=2993939 RepID=A0AAE3MJ43_9FLAO|nr:polyprenyl synthetase family protein [Lentiprolixibacter aurantiacus]MCX2718735.1 polyprenyl synthetase family protein [Lentiprolixibacter aurantiacus]